MRKHAGSWMIKVVLGVIVVVFVFWGVGSYRSQRGNRVAVVNGAVISLDEYRSAYEQLRDQYRMQFGDALDQKLVERLGLRGQALDQLIHRRLLLQQAERLGLYVTDKELARTIQEVPAFQSDGGFDPRRYEVVLARNRITPEVFEDSIRQDLLVEKMRNIVTGSIKASDAEALETFKWREEKIRIDYVAFRPLSYEGITVTPEEMAAYFSEHQKDYELPPKVKVAYVQFDVASLEKEVDVTEEEINQYFDLNRDRYAEEKEVKARHILFKVDQDADEKTVARTRQKALKVLEEAKAGADFAELAKKYSEDPGSKTKGGDLGFFTKDRMVKPFSDAAFAMKPDEISEPVRTPFGWHIIKVEEVKEAKEPVLEEVKEEIRAKLVKDAARSRAYDRAEEMYDAAYGPGHLEAVAEARDVEVHETGFLALGDAVEEIKESAKFMQTAFDLKEGEVSEVLELEDGYYIVEVIGRKPAEIPEFKAVEDKVRKDLIAAKQGELAKSAAEEFLAALKEGADFQEEAKSRGLEPKTTEPFKRFGSIPGIGSERELAEMAFSLDASSPLAESVIKGRKDYYVIRLKERIEVDPKEFEAKKEETIRSLVLQKRQKAMEEWLAQLRRQSEITIQEGFLD
jgi:peptidyl-prolyl cis-trans isomerase D